MSETRWGVSFSADDDLSPIGIIANDREDCERKAQQYIRQKQFDDDSSWENASVSNIVPLEPDSPVEESMKININNNLRKDEDIETMSLNFDDDAFDIVPEQDGIETPSPLGDGLVPNGYIEKQNADVTKPVLPVRNDNFTEYDDEAFSIVETPDEEAQLSDQLPATDADFAVQDIIQALITDEIEAIRQYTNYTQSVQSIKDFENGQKLIDIFSDIIKEENMHIGMLQKALDMVAPISRARQEGADEASRIMKDGADALHPGMAVQSAIPVVEVGEKKNPDDDYTEMMDSTCTIVDVDDTF